MRRDIVLTHEFVEYIPGELKDGTIYVSIGFATVAHKCCCGCGNEVVTPLSPTDWTIKFDGQSISLDPSIGNWGFDCQSHYWIKHNKVKWAPRWSQKQIEAGRARDKFAKRDWLADDERQAELDRTASVPESQENKPRPNRWRKLNNWWPKKSRL